MKTVSSFIQDQKVAIIQCKRVSPFFLLLSNARYFRIRLILVFLLGIGLFSTTSFAQTILMPTGINVAGSANSCSGTFFDHNGGASNYSNNQKSRMTICPDSPNNFVEVTFNSFNIEAGFDSLLIYDGPTRLDPLIGVFWGTNNPGTRTSTHPSGCLTFYFSSDGSVTGPGWDASISCTCPVLTMPTGTNVATSGNACCGTFFDHNGGASNYSNNQKTRMTICPDSPNNFVEVTFNSFQIEAGFDSLLIYDGPTRLDPLIGVFWGTNNPGTRTSTHPSGCLTFYFSSDGSVTAPGWDASISCTCPILTMPTGTNVATSANACCGTFFDHNGASNYSNNQKSRMTICPDVPNEKTQVTFNNFRIEAGFDSLLIYDGPTRLDPLIGVFWGTNNPGTRTSTHASGCLTFYFSSDGSVTLQGWDASVTCVCPDSDGDGFFDALCGGLDCNDSDSAINPNATEIYCNGIDENCNGLADDTDFLMPTGINVSGSVNTCCGSFFDHNGGSTNYSNNQKSRLTICPDSPNLIEVTFNSFQIEAGFDSLLIYDGPTRLDPLIGVFWGTNNPGTRTSTHPSGCLTFYFSSDGSIRFSGWDASINCVPLCDLVIACPPDPAPIEGCTSADIQPTSSLAFSTTSMTITEAQFTGEGGTITTTNNISSITYQDVETIPTVHPKIVTRTFTIMNDCPVTETCVQTFTIQDTTPPTIPTCPPMRDVEGCSTTDITSHPNINLGFNPNLTLITANQFMMEGGVWADNCTPQRSITYQDVANGFCPIVVMRTFTLEDFGFNTVQCQQIINIEDTTPPTPVCNDITVTLDAVTGLYILQQSDIDAIAMGSNDNCLLIDTTFTPSVFDCDDVGPNTVTVTVEDSCNNVDSCTATVTVLTSPFCCDIAIPNLGSTAESCAGANDGSITVTATCTTCTGPPGQEITYTITPTAPAGPPISNFTGVFTGLAPNVYTVEVNDTNDPTCNDLGTITVAPGIACELNIQDPCNCLNNATVLDLDAGTGGDDGQFSEIVAITGPGGAPIPNPFLDFQVNVMVNGTDAFAIPPVGTQSGLVPIPPGTMLLYNPLSGHYQLPFVHIDSVGYNVTVQQYIAGVPVGNPFMIGNLCSYPNPLFNPVLQDEYCPNDPIVLLGGVDQNGTPGGSAIFTIDGNPAVQLDPTSLAVGPHTVVMTYIGGNTGGIGMPAFPGCTQTVQKVINIANVPPPTITCPAALLLEGCGTGAIAASGAPPFNPAVTPMSMANFVAMGGAVGPLPINPCANLSLTYQDVDLLVTCPMIVTRIWTVTDLTTNLGTFCIQVISIDDSTAPLVVCPPAAIIEGCNLGAIAASGRPAYDPSGTGTSNVNAFGLEGGLIGEACGILSVAYVDSAPLGVCPQTFVRTYTITDLCNNVGTCTQNLGVDDTTAPLVNVAPAVLVLEGCTTADIPAPNLPFAPAPTAMTPAGFFGAGGTLFDACGVVSGSYVDVAAGTCPIVITRTYTLLDLCGNPGVFVQIITIDDTTFPVITCPPAAALEGCSTAAIAASGRPAYSPGVIANSTLAAFMAEGGTAADACGISMVQYFDAPAVGTCPITVVRTYGVFDLCNNVSVCTQTITIDDTVAPAVVCPPASNINGCSPAAIAASGAPAYNPNGVASTVATFVAQGGTATDACGITFAGYIDAAVGNCPIVVTRTWVFQDACLNTSTCTRTFTIIDIAPVVTCPAAVAIEGCDTGAVLFGGVPAGMARPGFSAAPTPITAAEFAAYGGTFVDACGVASYSYQDVAVGTCPIVVTRTYSLTDICGNVGTCTQTITINDTTAPVLVCPPTANLEGCGTGAIVAPAPPFSTVPANSSAAAFMAQGGGIVEACGVQSVTYIDVAAGTCPIVVTRTYTITDLCGNASNCTQTININDTTAPTIACPGPLAIEGCDLNAIGASGAPAYAPGGAASSVAAFLAGGGTIADACGISAVAYIDAAAGICPIVVTRTWAVVDLCLNVSNCIQTISVDDTTPPVATCPADLVLEGCDVGDIAAGGAGPFCNQAQGGPGFPTDQGCENAICANDAFCCNTNWDGICANSAAGNPACADCLAPPANPPYSPGLANVTLATYLALGGTVVENCGIASITYFDTQAGACPIVVNRVYTITDLCGNIDACNQTITINDTQAPIIACPPTANVEGCNVGAIGGAGLPPFGGGAITPGQFVGLGGTIIEACGIASVTYADVAVGNCPTVVTRTYTIIDLCGNTSTCTRTINVDDTIAPAIDPPASNMTVECDGAGNQAQLDAWLASNGGAAATDACGFVWTNNFAGLSDDCAATGSATVTFTATDPCGNATATVATFAIVDSQAPTITCPPGATLTCFESLPTPPNTTAGFIAAGGTVTDVCSPTFTVFSSDDDNGGTNCPGDARVVVRTIFVQDECGNVSSCTQTFTYLASTQGPIITSILPTCYKYCADLANPMASDIEYTTDCAFGATTTINGPTVIGQENCPGTIYRYTYTVTDDCGRISAPVTRDFIIGNDGPTIECPTANLILECGDANNAAYIAEHLSQVTANSSCELGLTITNNFTGLNFTSCTNSTKVVTFTATDDCNRSVTCTTTITMQDNTAPVLTSTYIDGLCNEAVCGSNLNFWYNEWKAKVLEGLSATDNCDTNVSISAQGPNSPNQNCPDETTETVVTWVASDNCGNTASISYSFWVTALDTNEPPTAELSGMIHTEASEAVEDVEVTLTGGASFFNQYVTANDGMYEFLNVPLDQNYQITPLLDQNPMNGVSSFDLVLIAQHILNLNQLDSPYKMIAADINHSGSITTLDLVELRKMILYINTDFPDNTSWRFVEGAFVFPVPTNPFATAFPEVVDINGLLESVEHDFVGVKIGDVNGSAVPNNLLGGDDRSFNGDLNFNINDKLIKQGETYEVVFSSDDFKAISGYQYTLNFDATQLEFVDLQAGNLPGMSEANFGLSLIGTGAITTSWTNNEPMTVGGDEELFRITFKAKETTQLSEALSISSRFTKAEAYDVNTENGQLNLLDVDLRYEDVLGSEAPFALMQNSPNPFRDETVIGFILPEATTATMTIFDVSGKQLKLITGDYEAGYNEVSLDRSDLASGMLYYRLETATHNATKKMMLIGK